MNDADIRVRDLQSETEAGHPSFLSLEREREEEEEAGWIGEANGVRFSWEDFAPVVARGFHGAYRAKYFRRIRFTACKVFE